MGFFTIRSTATQRSEKEGSAMGPQLSSEESLEFGTPNLTSNRRFWSRLFHRRSRNSYQKPTQTNNPNDTITTKLQQTSSTRKTKHRHVCERLFGHHSNSSLVLEASETLTQRYMNSNYDKLMEDVDAIPFNLSVEEPSRIRSRISKALYEWSPIKGSSSRINAYEIDSDDWNPYSLAKKHTESTDEYPHLDYTPVTSEEQHTTLRFTLPATISAKETTCIKNSSRFGTMKRRMSRIAGTRKSEVQLVAGGCNHTNLDYYNSDEQADDKDLDDSPTGTVVIHSQTDSSLTLFLQDLFDEQDSKQSMFSPMKPTESLNELNELSGSTQVFYPDEKDEEYSEIPVRSGLRAPPPSMHLEQTQHTTPCTSSHPCFTDASVSNSMKLEKSQGKINRFSSLRMLIQNKSHSNSSLDRKSSWGSFRRKVSKRINGDRLENQQKDETFNPSLMGTTITRETHNDVAISVQEVMESQDHSEDLFPLDELRLMIHKNRAHHYKVINNVDHSLTYRIDAHLAGG